MKFRLLLRPALTIVFGFFGAFIARWGTPSQILAVTGEYFVFVAFVAFAVLGFILPDIIELAGKASITVLAKQISERIPNPSASRLSVPRISLRRRHKAIFYENPMVLDTSALIDGRIGDVVKTGFLYGTFLVIPSVISELQALADSADDGRRARGRHGLDTLRGLQKIRKLKLIVLQREPKDANVDDKLVSIAKKVKGKLVTVDFNLNKVGRIKGVDILNVNELTNAVKTAVLPSEILSIKVSALGKEKDQGVGYLDDGTMVVIEGGASSKGKKINVSVHRVFQTAAGQMIFARLA